MSFKERFPHSSSSPVIQTHVFKPWLWGCHVEQVMGSNRHLGQEPADVLRKEPGGKALGVWAVLLVWELPDPQA